MSFVRGSFFCDGGVLTWGGFLASGRHVAVDPVTAKKRLVDAGVDFRVPDGEPEIEGTAESCLVCYVVTLEWCNRAVGEVGKRVR